GAAEYVTKDELQHLNLLLILCIWIKVLIPNFRISKKRTTFVR
ncbi:hypothetical protein HMPREF9075_01151, partial [Capnocytophaga sp. oral taxon 332 str. F0381]